MAAKTGACFDVLGGKLLIPNDFSLLLTNQEINARLQEITTQLKQELPPENVTFVGVLDGALFFLTDIIRNLDLNVQIDFLRVSSYQGTMNSGNLKLLSGLTWNVSGHEVVLVDDIFDSGKTMTFCRDHLLALGAKSVKCVALLAKQRSRDLEIDDLIVGFRIPDRFVIGYGLDWQGRYRHLPDIYAKKEIA